MDERSEPGGDVFAERRAKLAAWRDAGDVYPTQYQPRDEIGPLHETYAALEAGQDSGEVHRIAGRVMARRVHGKLTFVVLKDFSGEVQLFAQLDVLGQERYAAIEDVDLGDFVGAEGAVMRTRRGELSLRVTSWELLSKSLRPMPEKFHGLTDVETRYRRRYLDLMVNDDSREVFVMRARIIRSIREFLDGRGFVEVETPVLQPLYGGALARPFTTHHNELERDLYLRIATELYLKRCIIGGIDRVYEMGKDFRNEGVSFKHNPEFTMLETYEAYVDYNHVMDMVEQMVVEAARTVGDLKVTFRDHDIDLTPPWPRLTMRKAIENETGIDIGEIRDVPALHAAIKEHGFDGVTLAPTWGLQVTHGARVIDADVDAGLLLDRLAHRETRPRRREVDLVVAELDFEVADGASRLGDHLFDHRHHVVVVHVGLVGLEHRELGIVLEAHALVAEVLAHLVDAVDAADDAALEVQLGGDAQVEVALELVVVGDERPRQGAAVERL